MRLFFVHLLTEWEGRAGKHLAQGHRIRIEHSEVCVP